MPKMMKRCKCGAAVMHITVKVDRPLDGCFACNPANAKK